MEIKTKIIDISCLKRDMKDRKKVRFNTAMNVYIEPKQNTCKPWTKEQAVKRRNGISLIKRDSFEVLRFLSLHTAWSLGETKNNMKTEIFAEFLDRTAPKLYAKFYEENKELL